MVPIEEDDILYSMWNVQNIFQCVGQLYSIYSWFQNIFQLNPLAVNDEYTRSGNLIFLWPWIATHAPGSGLISTYALIPKTRTVNNKVKTYQTQGKKPKKVEISLS